MSCKSDGQVKSSKTLISWQEANNRFLSFLSIDSFLLVDKKPDRNLMHNCKLFPQKPSVYEKCENIGFRSRSLRMQGHPTTYIDKIPVWIEGPL